MNETGQLVAIGLLLATSLATVVVVWKLDWRRLIVDRLHSLSAEDIRVTPSPRAVPPSAKTLPKVVAFLSPVGGAERNRLKNQLIHAGLYRPSAMTVYLGVKLILMLGPVAVGVIAALTQTIPLTKGILFGTLGSGLGLVVPSLWLQRRTSARQLNIRRAIPDFLDVVVICLEAGLSFQAAMQRVHAELESAFPLFTFELNIVLHEVQLGMSTGEALQRFAERSDMPEVRSLATVVVQSERYGASLTKALRVHARALRVKRAHYAEEKGQKASVKIVFPTILFIFPAIFIVILGPAMIQIYAMMSKMK